MPVKSPYNFVPISDKVFFPDWYNQVSHDIPFSDQKSGKLTVYFVAESPIYVKNGGDSDNSFSKLKNQYFIPGTSIKGVIRNFLEIISFGKMKLVDNRKYSWRCLQNENYTSRFVKDFKSEPKVRAGFIQEDGDNWYLIPAKMARIEQCELDTTFGTHKGLLTAKKKYEFWLREKGSLERRFTITGPGTNVFVKQCGKFRRAKFCEKGGVSGTLVFTGQIQPRNPGREGKHGKNKKHLEFVFYDKDYGKRILISDEMKRDFELNHSRERLVDNHKLAKAPNEEWDFWKKRLKKGKLMPVFWLKNEDGTVESFGLAMLFRLPYKNSIFDLIPEKHKKNKPDLAELIFGSSDEDFIIKGRVQFGIAEAMEYIKELPEKEVVLSSPKPTFYPNYIKQTEKNLYKTYDNNDASLSGWKRYPVQKSNVPNNNYSPNNKNIRTKIRPLQQGAIFKFTIRYHNLKPVELGALLSALTFHGHQDRLFHLIGMGKSLGYGKIRLLNIESTEDEQTIIDCMEKFESEMDNFLGRKGRWRNHDNIRELFLMSSETNIDDKLVYMSLEEHLEILRRKESLTNYSSLVGKKFNLDPKLNVENLKKLLRKPSSTPDKKVKSKNPYKDMTISQFKKVLNIKIKSNDYDINILKILDSKDSKLSEYLKEKISKRKGKIYEYIQKLKEIYNYSN